MPDTWTLRLIRSALRLQDRVDTSQVPGSLKEAGAGRKAQFCVEGEDGCQVFLKWDGKHLVEELGDDQVRNVFRLHSQTLADIANGELPIREAVAARLLTVEGDRSIYDMEDIAQMLEKIFANVRQVLGLVVPVR